MSNTKNEELNKILNNYKSIKFQEQIIKEYSLSIDNKDVELIEYDIQRLALDNLWLHSPRLEIRRFSLLDLDAMFECTSNEEMMIPDGGSIDKNINEAKESLEFLMNTKGKYAIILKSENKMIGFISLQEIHDRAVTAFDLGFSINPKYQNMGYASEAIKRILDFAFLEMNVPLITAFHFINNDKSRRILLKFNFNQEGIKKKAYYHPHFREIFDLVQYSTEKNEYIQNSKKNSF